MDQQIADLIAEYATVAEELESEIARRAPTATRAGEPGRPDRRQQELESMLAKIEQLQDIDAELARLEAEAYDLRQTLNVAHRRDDAAAIDAAQADLYANQRQIIELTAQANAFEKEEDDDRLVRRTARRGAGTTGLVARVHIQMEQVPTSYYHLLNKKQHPLVRCAVRNVGRGSRRIRVSAQVEGYTARDVWSFEVKSGTTVESQHLPTFFPQAIADVRELTRATLNIEVEDLDTQKIEIHQTIPVWLLARNSAPLAIRNAETNAWTDFSQYFGAFVTPHRTEVEGFLSDVVAEEYTEALSGYQAGPVTSQVAAIYRALQKKQVRYVDSIIDFAPEAAASTQRVRLPRETLNMTQANCIDGVLLMASLMEAIGINPAIVLVPGHAIVGWSTVKPSGPPGSENEDDSAWDYLETTYLGMGHDFDEARATGRAHAEAAITQQRKADADPNRQGETWFRRWSLRQLRAQHGITPME